MKKKIAKNSLVITAEAAEQQNFLASSARKHGMIKEEEGQMVKSIGRTFNFGFTVWAQYINTPRNL